MVTNPVYLDDGDSGVSARIRVALRRGRPSNACLCG